MEFFHPHVPRFWIVFKYNTGMQIKQLTQHTSSGGQVEQVDEGHWRLTVPSGEPGRYRLAQMDDYHARRRPDFLWCPPLSLSFSARASGRNLPGTWGIGLWNDPFGFAVAQGAVRLLPALPNAAWFFFASEPNYLSFRDDVPAVGQLAGVFRTPHLPVWLFAPAVVLAPLLTLRPAARLLRRVASRLIAEDAVNLVLDPVAWHHYQLGWQADKVAFWVDDDLVFETPTSPRGPLGLVLWIDNQFAAWAPDGMLKYGTLANESAWIEIRGFETQELKVG
jgi:hypothetical protein